MNLADLFHSIAARFDADIQRHEERGIQLQREALRSLLQDCYVTCMADYIQKIALKEADSEPT